MRQYHVGLVLTAAGFVVMLGRSLPLEVAGGCLACVGAWIALRAERPPS